MARARSKLFVIQKHAGSTLHYATALTRVGGGRVNGGGSARERWILVKTRDSEADARRNPVSTQPESALSGRTIEEVAARG